MLAKYQSGVLNTSAVTITFQNLNIELVHGLKWQSMAVTYAEGQTEEGVYAIEKSNAKAGVGQILKLYLEYFSSYVHFSKLKWKT